MSAFGHVFMILLYALAGAGTAYAVNALIAMDWTISGVIGAVTFLALSQLHMALSRSARGRETDEQINDLARSQKDVAERVDVLDARTNAVETTVKHELTERRDALVTEMKQLEGLIERLSRNFESRLEQTSHLNGRVTPVEDQILRTVREALAKGRVDLHLQPIVNLPQRRVCFYEGFSRLRHADGSLILPAEFMDAARRAKLLGVIDHWMLYRSVQIVRMLAERDRRIGVFCNISAESLEDEVFPAFLQFMRQNQDLSGALIFELEADRFEARSKVMRENMNRLSGLGFRFSIDNVETMSLDLPRLQDAGVRFVKMSGQKLLTELANGKAQPVSMMNRKVVADEINALFQRYQIALIAEKMEDEASVVEILEHRIPYGQGHVFGSPRPIKSSLMQETTPPDGFIPPLANAN